MRQLLIDAYLEYVFPHRCWWHDPMLRSNHACRFGLLFAPGSNMLRVWDIVVVLLSFPFHRNSDAMIAHHLVWWLNGEILASILWNNAVSNFQYSHSFPSSLGIVYWSRPLWLADSDQKPNRMQHTDPIHEDGSYSGHVSPHLFESNKNSSQHLITLQYLFGGQSSSMIITRINPPFSFIISNLDPKPSLMNYH